MFVRSIWLILTAAGVWTATPVGLVAQQDLAATPENLPDPILPLVPGAEFVDTATPILPGAEEVVGDVQSVMFWSRYQRGEINGHSFVVFPDGSATIMKDDGQREAQYTLACTAGEACEISRADDTSFSVAATGGPRPDPSDVSDNESLARYLAEWILAGTGGQPPAPADPVRAGAEASSPQAAPDGLSDVAEAGAASDGTAENLSGEPGPEPGEGGPTPAGTAEGSDDPSEWSCLDLPGFIPDTCNQQRAAPGPRNAGSRPTPPPPDTAIADAASEEDEKESFAERLDLTCLATGTFSLRYTDPDTQETTSPGKPRISLGCSARFTEKLSLQFFFREYLDPDEQQPWDPDFTYALTYVLTERFNLTYSNYLARFDGPSGYGNALDSLREGNLRLNYKLPYYELPHGESLACIAGIGLPSVLEERVSFSCGAAITKKLRVGATAYLYFPDEQSTYEPDFSYTASYRFSDRFSVTYSNYSNNRWVGNEGDAPGPGFVGGSLSFTYRFEF